MPSLQLQESWEIELQLLCLSHWKDSVVQVWGSLVIFMGLDPLRIGSRSFLNSLRPRVILEDYHLDL